MSEHHDHIEPVGTRRLQPLSGYFCFFSEKRGQEYDAQVICHDIYRDPSGAPILENVRNDIGNWWGSAYIDEDGIIRPGSISTDEKGQKVLIAPEDNKSYRYVGENYFFDPIAMREEFNNVSRVVMTFILTGEEAKQMRDEIKRQGLTPVTPQDINPLPPNTVNYLDFVK